MRNIFLLIPTAAVVVSMTSCISNDRTDNQSSGPQAGAPKTISLKAFNEKFVVCALDMAGDTSGTLIASRDAVGTWETFDVRDLGGNRIALKAFNGKYVCADLSTDGTLKANRDSVADWETFELVDMGQGRVALLAFGGRYVTCDLTAEGRLNGTLKARSEKAADWEIFTIASK